MSQTCQYTYSPNQSLVAHTGSATGSNHSLDAPVVYKISSTVHGQLSQIMGPGVRPKTSCPRTVLGCVRCTQVCSELVCHQHCCAYCCCPIAPMPKKTVNGQKICILSVVAKTKQGGAVILESDAAKWLSEDVRRVGLAFDVLGPDGVVGDQLADLELAAVDVL
eukprot:2906497-Pleurochrysis_carterae.AAC.1